MNDRNFDVTVFLVIFFCVDDGFLRFKDLIQ